MPDIPLVPSLWHFPAQPASVRRARQVVAEALPHGLRSHLGDDLALLTSELVTNAIRYGARAEDDDRVELVLWPADGHYWLAVSDPGNGGCPAAPRTPALAHPGPNAESGRGLLLVDHLAGAWTVRPRATRGTSVIAGLRIPSPG